MWYLSFQTSLNWDEIGMELVSNHCKIFQMHNWYPASAQPSNWVKSLMIATLFFNPAKSSVKRTMNELDHCIVLSAVVMGCVLFIAIILVITLICIKVWRSKHRKKLEASVSSITLTVNSYDYIKGVFNLSNQPSYFSRNWGMQGGKTKCHKFHGLVLPHVYNLSPKIAINPTNFTWKELGNNDLRQLIS